MKEEKPEPLSDAMRGKKHGFMKKGSRVKIPSGKTDFFRGPQLRIGRDGLRIFEKTIDWLHNSRMGVTWCCAYDRKNT